MRPSDHALATTIGGRPSGGRPRFLPPPPAEPGAPPPPALEGPPAPAPFFFGVCCCSGAGDGVAIPPESTTDAADADNICGLSTGVAGGTMPIDPGTIAPPATTAAAVTATGAIPTGPPVNVTTVEGFTAVAAAVAAVGSFGLAFFFEPDVAAAIAALLGRIT